MELYRIDIKTHSCFLTPIKGDMLFGVFCWHIVDLFGEDRLTRLLEGYTENKPFIVFSDALPTGYLPKPNLPFLYYKNDINAEEDAGKRKAFKRLNWVAKEHVSLPTPQMAAKFEDITFLSSSIGTSNHVNPQTGHADGGEYSAFLTTQYRYQTDVSLYAVIDESRLSVADVEAVMKNIGQIGFGKKASSGKGKFDVLSVTREEWKKPAEANAYLTLAPVVPQAGVFDSEKSFYRVFVRFGRHGNKAAFSQNPFKRPVLTMDTATVLTPKDKPFDVSALFVGTGVKGVSLNDDKAVFQGYAPIVPICLKEGEIK